MKKADDMEILEGDEGEMMSDGAMKRLLEYLKSIGWTDEQIVKLLTYVAGK